MNSIKGFIAAFALLFIQACTHNSLDYCCIESNNCAFALYQESEDELIVVNQSRASERFSPASTFKIANSLIALETNILSGTDQVLSVDLETYPEQSWWMPNWATDTFDLRGAFQNSVFPIYQSISSDIGSDTMCEYLTCFDYGNQDISSGIDNFWVAGSMKISALEQIEFLQKV